MNPFRLFANTIKNFSFVDSCMAKENPYDSPDSAYNEELSENSTIASQGFTISRQNSEELTSFLPNKMIFDQDFEAESMKESEVESCLNEEEEENLSRPIKDFSWTIKRERYLKMLTTKHRYDWKKIAQKFNEKEESDYTGLELKQKFKEVTKSTIPMRVKFTHEEDLMLSKHFETYGCDWAKIATFFTDRTALMLKNRYYSHIRKNDLIHTMLKEVKNEGVNDVKEEEVTSTEVLKPSDEFTSEGSLNLDWDLLMNFSIERSQHVLFDMNDALRSELNETITVNYC